MKTIKLHHPTLSGVTVDVPERDVSQWQDAGWLKSKPKAVREAEKADDK